jgi:hypothetical protein
MYYLLCSMLVVHPFLLKRTNSSGVFGILILAYSIFLALLSNELGTDFQNYQRYIDIGVVGRLPENEVLFLKLLDFAREYDLSARSICVLNGSLLMLSILMAPKSIRGLVSNIITSIFLVVSVFNGLRLGFAISLILLLYMISLRFKFKVGDLLLIPTSVATHTSLLFPTLIYFFFMPSYLSKFSKILLALLLVGFVAFFGLEYLYFPLLKLLSYFDYDNELVGGFSLAAANGFMIFAWRNRTSRSHIIFFALLIAGAALMSTYTYFGIRILGILPLAFYMVLISNNVLPKMAFSSNTGIGANYFLQLSFLIFALINAKNILYGYADNYIF